MSYPRRAQGSLLTMDALKGCLKGNIQDLSGIAKFKLFFSPYLKEDNQQDP